MKRLGNIITGLFWAVALYTFYKGDVATGLWIVYAGAALGWGVKCFNSPRLD